MEIGVLKTSDSIDSCAAFLISTRIQSSDTQTFSNRLRTLNSQLLKAPGFKSLDVVQRKLGSDNEFLLIMRFKSEETLNRWKGSEGRLGAIAELDQLAIAPVIRQQASGQELWFNLLEYTEQGTHEAPFWKRWVLSIIAVYPPLLILSTIASLFLKSLPQPLSMFAIVVALTGILTGFIMPLLTRLTNGWLAQEK